MGEDVTTPPAPPASLLRSIERRYVAEGQLAFPAVPALLDHYTELVAAHFANLARPVDARQRAALRALLAEKLEEAFAAAPQSNVFVRYHVERTSSAPITYAVACGKSSLEEEYDYWVATRVGSLFGKHPDAKVLEVAASLGAPGAVRVLDVGAGTGRNSLPLARRGHSVVALELAPALTDVLADEIRDEPIALRVVCGNVFDRSLELTPEAFELAVVAEVVPHLRNVEQLRDLFARAAELLARDGCLLLSAFVTKPGFVPDAAARQIAEVCWSAFFTPEELAEAHAGHGFDLVSDERVLDYERAHLPPEAYPPTRWFESWASGSDAFDVPAGQAPIELRWLAYRRRA